MRKTFFLLSVLTFLSLSIVNQSVFGLFSDTAQNLNNSFTAAANFPSASPSASPSTSASPSSSPSSSPSATPSSSPSGSPSQAPSASPSPSPSSSGTVIIISGNGEGSSNTVDIENTKNCTVNQTNNSNISFNISSNSNTGGNSGNSDTGDSTSTVDVAVTGGSSSSTGCP